MNQLSKITIIQLFIFLSFLPKIYGQHSTNDWLKSKNETFDVLPGFQNPPKGYGEVPFYWWQGDTLTKERISWQLDQLKDKCISSLQINYSHLDSGGLIYGLSRPSKPALFTPEWWDLFKWFAKESQKRGMTISVSDYTLGVGQGFSMDDALKEIPEMNGSILRDSVKIVTGKCKWKLPPGFLNVTAFQTNSDGSVKENTRVNLLPYIKDGNLIFNFGKETCQVNCIYEEKIIPSYNPMHPKSGEAYIHHFFDRFEEALPPENKKALDFFFSDELNFRLSGNIWDNRFAEEFKKRKGYDIVPYLDALFNNIGDITPKIRLDYNDVMVSLSEENFFIPVFEWHEKRGLTYGCDHGGRGRDVTEFGDYFRTQRWNQGPGSDQPRVSKDIIKAKVAASIAHLYNRPRVWLEGFHSSGWGTSSADVTEAILANFVAGYNLLSFHGFYYSTMGGWWEWAPPDNHFRMPYWSQIEPLMKCTERLSYTLSQGNHVCDVAIIYPTEPVVAEMDGNNSVQIAFKTGELIYNKAIDFDFIDYESIARAETKNGELQVSGEKYKVVIVPSMEAIRFSTLQKLKEFQEAGGLIVNIGEKPAATEKNGLNDTEVEKLVASIFSGKNTFQCKNAEEVLEKLPGSYSPNFKVLSELEELPYVMHRSIGERDIYALYNFPKNTKCFFNSKGSAQLWNPWNGEISSLVHLAKETNEGTEITLPLSKTEIQLIVFEPEEKSQFKEIVLNEPIRCDTLDDIWNFELKPSLDNRWGDFELPASEKLMGAQVRQVYFKENENYKGGKPKPDSTWDMITCAYGTHFMKLGPLAKLPKNKQLLKFIPEKNSDSISWDNKKYAWEPYKFSWQRGVEGDYGHQGWHGLKGEMYDNFIRLGAIDEFRHSRFRVPEKEGSFYVLYTEVVAPNDGIFDLLTGEEKPVLLFINGKNTNTNSSVAQLKKGKNPVLIVYNKACETYLVFRKPDIPLPEKQPISMCWYGDSGVLPFDCSSVTQANSGLYTFQSAPGLEALSFTAYGDVSLWIDSNKYTPEITREDSNGLKTYAVNIKNAIKETSNVVLKIDYQAGYTDGAALPQYFRQTCGEGIIKLGDWSEIDGLKAYSGGASYSKTIDIDASKISAGKIEIDLGEVVSSAELIVNGKSAGIKLAPPYKFDITEMAQAGENKIEVLVYNTLSNNFIGTPTRFRGSIKSGLLGPVTLLTYKKNNE
ncbi:hypothetical protein GM418_11510 [Maribellus comscasis]|uniref:Glycosyl hydrolases family 2 sugar binding domain-containing protein n=1 Tax=Maribellus comscasis TaxID=2681766 RepID=A0A6I6JSP9_9BACT|nr:glycosyl hydrolase [Maribellus comscasis]QGY44259.1 hypothetical protein GM418_11510 [Maribellus comscasis]